jgi:hypothetical protein
MNTCIKFETCPFTHCDTQFKKLNSIDHYVEDYCNGEKHDHCVVFQIDTKFGHNQVPSNMMPNGLPLPGTHKRDWTEIALEYKKHINKKPF